MGPSSLQRQSSQSSLSSQSSDQTAVALPVESIRSPHGYGGENLNMDRVELAERGARFRGREGPRDADLPVLSPPSKRLLLGSTLYAAATAGLFLARNHSEKQFVQACKVVYCQQFENFTWLDPLPDMLQFQNIPQNLFGNCIDSFNSNQTVPHPNPLKPSWDMWSLDVAGPFPSPRERGQFIEQDEIRYQKAIFSHGRTRLVPLDIQSYPLKGYDPAEETYWQNFALLLLGILGVYGLLASCADFSDNGNMETRASRLFKDMGSHLFH